jgi:hypothetical protein
MAVGVVAVREMVRVALEVVVRVAVVLAHQQHQRQQMAQMV